MATQQDTFDNSDNLATLENSEVSGGVLQASTVANCIEFDGTNNSRVVIGTFGGADPLALNGSDFTVHLWVRTDFELGSGTDNNKSFSRIIDKSNGSNSTGGYGIYIHSDRKIYMACNGTSYTHSSSIRFPEDERWHHLAFTADGALWRLYLDGVQIFQANQSKRPPSTSCPLHIGGRPSSTTQNANCRVRSAYIHNAALTPAEISRIYEYGFIPTANIVDGWELNESSGSTAASYSGSNDGTLSADAAFVSSDPFVKLWSNTISNNIGALMTSPSSIDSFSYTLANDPKNNNARVQFSSDNSTWKSSDGSVIPSGVYEFDGLDDYLDFGASFFTSAFSFSCWTKAGVDFGTSDTYIHTIASDRNKGAAGTEDGWSLYFQKSGLSAVVNIYAIVEDSGSYVFHTYEYDRFQNGKWNHVSLTWNPTGQSLNLYVNGVPLATSSTSVSGTVSSLNSSNNFYIGRRANNVQYFEGEICHPVIHQDELTASEVGGIYLNHNIPSDNLLSQYLFNGNVNDATGSNNGSAAGGAVNKTGEEYIPALGRSLDQKYSYRFDGIDDFITIADDAALDFASSSFTVSANVFLDSQNDNGGWSGIFSKLSGTAWAAGVDGYCLIFTGGGGTDISARKVEGVVADGSVSVDIEPSFTLKDHGTAYYRWTHLTMVVDRASNIMFLYQDGIKSTGNQSTSSITDPSTTVDAWIGKHLRYVNGRICNVAVWNDVRSEAEILQELENGYVDTTDANLVGYWPLNGDADDYSSNSNNGTVSGATSQVDPYRPISAAPSQQTISLSSLSLTDTVYYRIVSDSFKADNEPTTLTETTFTYTSDGGGGGDPITGPTTKTLSFASSNGDEEIIAAPDANKNIVLLGATSSVACVLKETDASGAVIAYIPAGHSKFKAPVKVASGTAVHVQGASNITLFFTQIHS
jgi:hypothetical protein